MMATAKADFFRGSWIADYPDAENYLSLFYSANKAPNGPNYTQFSHPLFDKWYEESRMTTDLEKRLELYSQMDSLVMYEAPIIPLYYDQVVRFYRPETEGLQSNPLNLLTLKRVRKR
jgi:peptide/nickel transport system substrate-binding protein